MQQTNTDDDSTDTDTKARRRAAYLRRTTDLTDREADALAYSELGFSYRGVAKQIDSTAGTVQTYLERAAATYGPHIAGCRNRFQVDADLEPVEPEDAERWMRDTQERWFALVERHPDRAPDWYGGGER
jgi:DNA-binding CsgD family transcriptional regulator